MDNEAAEEAEIYRKSLEILAEIVGHSYEAGDLIFAENEPGMEIYFIVRGGVEVYLEEGGGHRVLMELGDGDVFGEMALINHMPRTASVRALIPTRAVAIDRRLFYHLIGEYPILAKKVIDLMGYRMNKMHGQFKAVLDQQRDEG